MASDPNFVDFVLDQIKNAGEITAKKMFGEYSIYSNEKINFDCLLIRHTAYDVFYNADTSGGFWFNNYPIGK